MDTSVEPWLCKEMKTRTRTLSLLALLLITLLTTGDVTSSNARRGENGLLEDVLRGLDKAADFFSEDYSSVNTDGLFGIRVAQGTLIQSLEWCSSRCPDWLVQRLDRLNHTLGVTADSALSYVESQDLKYYSMFHKTIEAPYLIDPSELSLDEESMEPGTATDYVETKGDQCLAGVMGTLGNKRSPPCSVTDDCMAMMTMPKQAAYSLTHQLLYYIIAEKEHCMENFDAQLNGRGLESVKKFERQLCSHIYAEAKMNVINGSVMEQDLFLEQSLLCGIIGYQEFFQPAWVRLVLSWQTWRGCFTTIIPSATKQVQGQKQRGQDRLLELLREEARKIDSKPSITHRKLLREQKMEGDCLSHKSGLGIGLLGVYQRHLIKTSQW